jgi:hypothetical protein
MMIDCEAKSQHLLEGRPDYWSSHHRSFSSLVLTFCLLADQDLMDLMLLEAEEINLCYVGTQHTGRIDDKAKIDQFNHVIQHVQRYITKRN